MNADALQVYDCWRVLSARPPAEDEAQARHLLYGHVAWDVAYSVGDWLRDLAPILSGSKRPIIVGGTGLYLTTLTQGLADIPPTPPEIRQEADARRQAEGHDGMLAELDPETRARVDVLNPMRVQRAWEVLRTTGKGLAAWHAETPPPLLPLSDTQAFVIDADRDWLADRIDRRFDMMLDQGALDEVRAMEPRWNPDLLSSKAIGAPELIAYLRGELSLDEARLAAQAATRQYAKRQRTWFRARMKDWTPIPMG